ncbi:glutamate--tRNA ligase [Falsochrobactrum ovis]|uniref:Glutamate--tRNA ligase n=1 Tax=Falsochrobactrum ovis TaxID=1293442 RepID=A0A364JTX7_9HYPH|nr:glutamate--tRNA ligase [Falsochrobactrum ovis]RAK27581.1 glutamyl-tRNA synthetase /glutamate--tRNA(Gln) ligase [Falsochrobactrum ovis]
MSITVRFAPSPTGYIHIGNTRTALSNWLYAQKNRGQFILRYDDTDIERSRDEYARSIAVDLDWLGIKPDRVEYQSKRFDVYAQAADKLREAGLLYPCYETADELERRRKLRLARRLPPIYGREALKLTEDEKAKLEAEGRKPHWRFLLPNFENDPMVTRRTEVHWDDLVRGPQTVDLASMSDPVLIREDGTYLYTLPSVADDIDMGVTHIIRGDDHVTNTGAQIAIFRALGAEPPVFGHHNLLTTVSGEGLSKRTGALSLGSLREAGYEPMAIASLAVLIGTSEAVSAVPNMKTLAEHFDLSAITKSAAKFDPAELDTLNRTLLHEMTFEQAKDRLEDLGIKGEEAEPFWLTIRKNLDRFGEVSHWWQLVRGDLSEKPNLSDDDIEFVRQAFDFMPQEPWNNQTWKIWTERIKEATGRKGKSLFLPLRLALTGQAHGPEMADLLVLIGRQKTLDRRP